jgi:hypothetical protein
MSRRSKVIIVSGDFKDADSLGGPDVRKLGKMPSRLAA